MTPGTRRVLFVDGSAGASGDMILGALVDLGAPVSKIRAALAGLPVTGWTLRSRRVTRAGLRARKIDVRVRSDAPARGWRQLQRILARGGLAPAVRGRAAAIFRSLIEAEAEAHGLPFEKVHLHEAGGIDAIVDVVGACVALDHLAVDRIVVSRLTTGFGNVSCAHGLYPVPAPATLLLTRGHPVRGGEIEAERLTPTGAAILTTIADDWGALPPLRPLAIGCGAGDRDLPGTPNVLRMVLGETELPLAAEEPGSGSEIVVIECAVDDATPQLVAYAVECLRAAGALDVAIGAVTMKKGRPGHQLTVLARPEHAEALAAILLKETTSLGLRYRTERRIELSRSTKRVATPFGRIDVKVGVQDGREVQAWPEYEQCAAIARRRGVALHEVQQAALAAYRRGSRRR